VTERPALILSPAFLSDPGLGAVWDALPNARVVGGAVRDAVAGLAVADIDFATPDPPETVTSRLVAAGLRAAPTGLTHGTVTAIAHHRGYEVTTLRRDVETDGRHARVAFTTDWREDAERRDFTYNAMSMTRDGAVFDYFGGVADLRAGVTRFVGDPATRVAEDYLRVLRFFRFYARFGAAVPDAKTEAALRDGVAFLGGLSVERVWQEFKRILTVAGGAAPRVIAAGGGAGPRDKPGDDGDEADNPSSASRHPGPLALMAAFGVLPAILPEGFDLDAFDRVLSAGAPVDPVLRLAALLTGDAATLATRLKLAGAERERLLAMRSGPVPPWDADDATLRRELADEPAETLIARSFLADDAERRWATTRDRLATMPRPVFPLAGRDLRGLGVPPGPDLGGVLAATRLWWLAGGCAAAFSACRDHALGLWRAGPPWGTGPDAG
jgi:poly(A) polymerase/tRNA nucleotidyltransferase (CCA-adding enzyme)